MSTNRPLNSITVTSTGSGYQTVPLGTISSPTWTNSTLTVPPSGRMELHGDQADIVMNGVSLNDTLKLIQDRLCMLRPNPELEQEWDQLRDLGEQYRELEKQLIEKQRAWDLLRKKEG